MAIENEFLLIKKASKNNVEAFEKLIYPYTTRLLNHAYGILNNREDAEDALQESYIKIFKSLDKFEGHSSFKTWIYRIVTNVCLDMLRKNKKIYETSINETNENGEYKLVIPDDTYSPEISAQKKMAFETLKNALEDLSQEHKTVVIMRDIDGLSYDEIAYITSTNVGTVKSRINRARIQLKNLLEKNKELFR
ncbi:MAG: sigma-70 family RNA polymerase sigma factor [Ruminococcaceae bacterium]|nr:sigma-70 family RNA polymerase sigma factor [Oscillospiraceae bacterium]